MFIQNVPTSSSQATNDKYKRSTNQNGDIDYKKVNTFIFKTSYLIHFCWINQLHKTIIWKLLNNCRIYMRDKLNLKKIEKIRLRSVIFFIIQWTFLDLDLLPFVYITNTNRNSQLELKKNEAFCIRRELKKSCLVFHCFHPKKYIDCFQLSGLVMAN